MDIVQLYQVTTGIQEPSLTVDGVFEVICQWVSELVRGAPGWAWCSAYVAILYKIAEMGRSPQRQWGRVAPLLTLLSTYAPDSENLAVVLRTFHRVLREYWDLRYPISRMYIELCRGWFTSGNRRVTAASIILAHELDQVAISLLPNAVCTVVYNSLRGTPGAIRLLVRLAPGREEALSAMNFGPYLEMRQGEAVVDMAELLCKISRGGLISCLNLQRNGVGKILRRLIKKGRWGPNVASRALESANNICVYDSSVIHALNVEVVFQIAVRGDAYAIVAHEILMVAATRHEYCDFFRLKVPKMIFHFERTSAHVRARICELLNAVVRNLPGVGQAFKQAAGAARAIESFELIATPGVEARAVASLGAYFGAQ